MTGFDASDGPVSTVLNGYVQGPTSKLGQILLGGELQQAFQLMTTISTVLNDDSFNGSPSGHSKREKVKKGLNVNSFFANFSFFVPAHMHLPMQYYIYLLMGMHQTCFVKAIDQIQS